MPDADGWMSGTPYSGPNALLEAAWEHARSVLRDLDFRPYEGYYSKSAKACHRSSKQPRPT